MRGKGVFFFFSEYQGSFPEVKQLGRDVDQSTPSGADVKKEWSYSSTPPIHLHAVDKEKITLNYFFLYLYIYVCNPTSYTVFYD